MTSWTKFTTALDDIITSEQVGLFSNLVATKTYDKLDAMNFGFLMEDVHTGDAVVNMLVSPQYNAIPNVDGDSCDIGACNYEPDYDGANWVLKMAECRYTVCTREAPKKFLALYRKYKAIRPDDTEYDFIIEHMSEIISDILANSLVAKLFLSNTDLTEDTINGIDGWIEQWKDGNGQFIEVGAAFDVDDGEEWYNTIMEGIDLFETGPYKANADSAVIIMDEAAARKIANWLNNADNLKGFDCSCINPDGVTAANRFTYNNLYISGHKVVPVPYTAMATAFDELAPGGELVDPVFAVITPIENNLIGAPARRELEMNESFYDNMTRSYYFDAGYQYGAMVASGAYVLITSEEA